MSDLCIFLNTRVENSGSLAWIGDKGLAPFRYLFNGKTIHIIRESKSKIEIDHVASFHEKGGQNISETDNDFRSSSTSMIKAALSVALLIPGLILGATFKSLAYLSSNVRDNHRLTKKYLTEYLTPIDREIGSESTPIKTWKELRKELSDEYSPGTENRLTNALIIYGDGKLTIEKDPGILRLNPRKLVLKGARIVYKQSKEGGFKEGGLVDRMSKTGKWEVAPIKNNTIKPSLNDVAEDVQELAAQYVHQVASVQAALEATAPRRDWTSCKRYRMIFKVV